MCSSEHLRQTHSAPLSPHLDTSLTCQCQVKCAQKFTVICDCHKLAGNLESFRSVTGKTCPTIPYNSSPNIRLFPLPTCDVRTSRPIRNAANAVRTSRTIRNAANDSRPGYGTLVWSDGDYSGPSVVCTKQHTPWTRFHRKT